jgi:hypothetical protein
LHADGRIGPAAALNEQPGAAFVFGTTPGPSPIEYVFRADGRWLDTSPTWNVNDADTGVGLAAVPDLLGVIELVAE